MSPQDDESIPLGNEEEPISLEDGPSEGMAAMKAFGAGAGKNLRKSQFKREVNVNGAGAVRCRVWTSKISIAALQAMEAQLNEWLDSENIEVKEVGHLVGTMQGKTPELNVIVIVWY